MEKRVEGVIEKVGGCRGRITFGGGETTPPESIQFGEHDMPRDGTRLDKGCFELGRNRLGWEGIRRVGEGIGWLGMRCGLALAGLGWAGLG